MTFPDFLDYGEKDVFVPDSPSLIQPYYSEQAESRQWKFENFDNH